MAQRLGKSRIAKKSAKVMDFLDKPETENAKLSYLEQKRINGLLLHAAEYGTLDQVERLLKKGADPNANFLFGETAFMRAATYARSWICLLLIRCGADITKKGNAIAIKKNESRRKGIPIPELDGNPG